MEKKNCERENRLKKASKLYDIDYNTATLLRNYSNEVYECDDKIIKISSKDYRTKNEIEIEIELINYLKDKNIGIVEIINSVKGNSLEELNNHIIVCFKKIIGKKVSKKTWNTTHFRELGVLTGKLHKYSKEFETQSLHQFKNWNEVPKSKIKHLFPESEKDLVDLHEYLTKQFQLYSKTQKNYGLIHYDIHFENYLIEEETNKIILFDFEMICKSWYLNEIAVILYYVLYIRTSKSLLETEEEFIKYFCLGYKEEFSLEELNRDKIQMFLLYRDLLVYGYSFQVWGEETILSDKQLRSRLKLKESIKKRREKIKI